MAEITSKKIPLDPTPIAYHTKVKGDDPSYLRAKSVRPKVRQLTRLYYDRGVLLTAGSDTQNPWAVPGVGLHQELRLLVEAGIPARDVIQSTTGNGARSRRSSACGGSSG